MVMKVGQGNTPGALGTWRRGLGWAGGWLSSCGEPCLLLGTASASQAVSCADSLAMPWVCQQGTPAAPAIPGTCCHHHLPSLSHVPFPWLNQEDPSVELQSSWDGAWMTQHGPSKLPCQASQALRGSILACRRLLLPLHGEQKPTTLMSPPGLCHHLSFVHPYPGHVLLPSHRHPRSAHALTRWCFLSHIPSSSQTRS